MEALGAEYGISGEGELAFTRLLDELERPEPACMRSNGFTTASTDAAIHRSQWRQSPHRRPAAPRSERPGPTLLHEYGIESLQTKRGCPLHCTYCTYPLLEGSLSRMRNPVGGCRRVHGDSAPATALSTYSSWTAYSACRRAMRKRSAASSRRAGTKRRGQAHQSRCIRRRTGGTDGGSRGDGDGGGIRQWLRRGAGSAEEGLPN